MAEPVLRDPVASDPLRRTGPQPVPSAAPELPPPREPLGELPAPASRSRATSQEMIEELRKDFQELTDRIQTTGAAVGQSLKRELSQDADYIKIRARYYHQRRPLQALGMVAAAGFVLGMIFGFWRR